MTVCNGLVGSVKRHAGHVLGQYIHETLGCSLKRQSVGQAIVMFRPCLMDAILDCYAAAGTDMRLANYLLLALAAFQFPFSFLLAYRPV